MRVGYRLWREIKPLFPPGTTPAERQVAMLIADDANEHTRIATRLDPKVLCVLAGLEKTGLKAALQRLSGRGLEFRVSFGKGRDGRPVYASGENAPQYRVPSHVEFMAALPILEGEATAPPHKNGKPP